MTDDLVKRLREAAQWQFKTEPTLYGEAADRIEAQDKRNKELEAALRFYAEYQPAFSHQDFRAVARAALGEKKDVAT